MKFLVADLECTSIFPLSAEILTAYFIKVDENLQVIDEIGFNFRPRIWRQGDDNAVLIHGITKEEAYTFPAFNISARNALDWLIDGETYHFVCHANRQTGRTFDAALMRMLALDFNRYFEFGQTFPEYQYLSTHSIAKYLNVPAKLNLKDLCNYFNLEDFNHHNAESDCKMTLKLLKKMIDKIDINEFIEWESYKKRDINGTASNRSNQISNRERKESRLSQILQ